MTDVCNNNGGYSEFVLDCDGAGNVVVQLMVMMMVMIMMMMMIMIMMMM
jgi:hypothetical protein